MLTAELANEELALLAKDDDVEALGMLISRNEGFVVFMASHFLARRGCHDRSGMCTMEDYEQICRLAIIRAVNNYEMDSSARFMTYAGKIMHRDMARQFTKDLSFREYITGTIIGEDDTLAEECDEEYGDDYDNGFEKRKAHSLEGMLPSLRFRYFSRIKQDDTEGQRDVDAVVDRGSYEFLLEPVNESEPEETEDIAEPKRKKYRGIYTGEKETGDSWKYPVCHEALKNLQMKEMLAALYDEEFDEAQREYLIYRYGLENQDPHKLKETAEHFHLTLANARKIEKAGLEALGKKLQAKKLF